MRRTRPSNPGLPALALALLGAAGCATDIPIALDILLPVDPISGASVLPPEVLSHELRVLRLREGESCPAIEVSLEAREPEREFVHAQQFDAAEGRGAAVGALPEGRYAFTVLSRGEGCAVWLYGCTEAAVGGGGEDAIEVRLRERGGDPAGCGACRSCEAARCAPDGAVCR